MTELSQIHKKSDMNIQVDRARGEDAAEVSELIRQTWHDTYPNAEAGITLKDIQLRTDGKNGERITQNIEKWREKILINDGSKCVFIARSNGKIFGMTAPGITDGKRRIGALYVLPEAQGLGVGGKLMQKALEWHGRDEDIYLSVASYNLKAINFYERFGFQKTDTPVLDEGNVYGNTLIPEIEMVLPAS